MLKRGILVTAVTLAILLAFGCSSSSGNKGDSGGVQPIIHTVTFVDHDGTELKVEQVEHGSAATAPADPSRTGHTFTGWSPSDFSEITADTTITAQYTITIYTVTFNDHDGAVLKSEQIEHGSAAEPPADPVRSGHIFIGWEPSSLSAITANTSFTALYVPAYSVGIEPAGIAENTILRLQLNGEHELELDSTANGNFVTFDQLLLDGVDYQVTIAAHPVNQLCQLSGHSDGTIDGQNITDITVQCTTSRLNDTGIDWCASGNQNNLDCPVEGYPGQDGEFGQDAAARAGTLTKVGSGAAGFDYTKISNSGNPLPADAELGGGPDDWACTRDNVTGLMWEVKVNDENHLRHMDHTYAWYNPDSNTNGGSAGAEGGTGCNGTLTQCNTQAFAQAVNQQGLCGYNDWRMPSRAELHSIMHHGRYSPAIDVEHFPNTSTDLFWSSSPYAGNANGVWLVLFGNGSDDYLNKDVSSRVRLVRAGNNE